MYQYVLLIELFKSGGLQFISYHQSTDFKFSDESDMNLDIDQRYHVGNWTYKLWHMSSHDFKMFQEGLQMIWFYKSTI